MSGDRGIGRILHSGKLRAEQTAQIIADNSGYTITPESCSGISPNDNAAEFIEDQGLIQSMGQEISQKISRENGGGNILIVSHMPFVSNLCSALLTGSTEVEFDFTPGTLACLFYEYEEWSMEYMIRPETY
jgi:phosphohistidine phosphatase